MTTGSQSCRAGARRRAVGVIINASQRLGTAPRWNETLTLRFPVTAEPELIVYSALDEKPGDLQSDRAKSAGNHIRRIRPQLQLPVMNPIVLKIRRMCRGPKLSLPIWAGIWIDQQIDCLSVALRLARVVHNALERHAIVLGTRPDIDWHANVLYRSKR